MKRNPWLLLGLALASTAAFGGDRAITVSPSLQSSWEFVTPGTGARAPAVAAASASGSAPAAPSPASAPTTCR